MLETKRGQFREIRKSLKDEREVQLVDFVKKSIKYQELLDINDTKKKRLPTLNSKVGEVKKMSVTVPTHHATSYHLNTEVQPHLNLPTPPTREGHSTLVHNNSAIVLGGHCSSPFPTGHVYSLSSNSWVRQFNLPSARSYHSTVLYKDRYAVVFRRNGALRCQPQMQDLLQLSQPTRSADLQHPCPEDARGRDWWRPDARMPLC